MLIACGRIVMNFYNNDQVSLKHKKLEELCKSLRHQFNISILEVADFDDPEKCVIGFAGVIPENWKTQSAHHWLEKICKTIDATSFARVMVEECELLSHGGP
jgi:uncharacterized protein YlxP (DUF503 family)